MTWPNHICEIGHDPFSYVTYDMTHSLVCDMVDSRMTHDMGPILMCDMADGTHSNV